MQVSNAARRSEPVASDATLRAERGGMVVKKLINILFLIFKLLGGMCVLVHV